MNLSNKAKLLVKDFGTKAQRFGSACSDACLVYDTDEADAAAEAQLVTQRNNYGHAMNALMDYIHTLEQKVEL